MSPTDLAEDARSVLYLLTRDPRRASRVAARLLDAARRGEDDEAAAVAGRALGLVCLHLRRLDTAVGHLEAAVQSGVRAGCADVAAEARMSLAFALSHRGDARAAISMITSALTDLSGVGKARGLAQRGAIQFELGRFPTAAIDFDAALPALIAAQDWVWVQRVHNNRAVLLIYQGKLAAARAELVKAERLCRQLGLAAEHAVVAENMAFLLTRQGDVPAAMATSRDAEHRRADLGAGTGTLLLDRSELLLSVGLLPEAKEAAQAAIVELTRDRRWAARAQAQLLLAETELLAGDPAAAHRVARRALAAFRRQHRPQWAALASQLMLRCRLATGGGGRSAVRATRQLAEELERSGWTVPALDARLLAARISLEHGDVAGARALLHGCSGSHRDRGPAAVRVRAWHAEALLRLAEGRRPGALRALRAGIGLVTSHQATLGASDLRSSVAASRAELVCLGLALTLHSGRARTVLQWAEHGRATALLTHPARPPDHPELADRLEGLRAASAAVEVARRRGDPMEAPLRRQAVLERAVRDIARIAAPPGRPAGQLDVDALLAALGDRVLVEFVDSGDMLFAVTAGGRRVRLNRLCRTDVLAPVVEHLRFALRRVERSHRRSGIDGQTMDGALDLVRQLGRRVDDLLLRPLRTATGEQPLVVVPAGCLQNVPWAVLPTCAGRPVTVSPSATLWLRACGATAAAANRVLAVAGPGLPAAVDEVTALSRLYGQRTEVLTGAAAGVEPVSRALARCDVAHLAAHGRFRGDNALFSHLRLADGPLTVYDLQALPRVPALVVLAACDVGRSSVSSGEELIGLAAAFLSQGTRTLVASLLPMVDGAAAHVMVALHGRLARGEDPASALACLQDQMMLDGSPTVAAAAAGLVCLGSDTQGSGAIPDQPAPSEGGS